VKPAGYIETEQFLLPAFAPGQMEFAFVERFEWEWLSSPLAWFAWWARLRIETWAFSATLLEFAGFEKRAMVSWLPRQVVEAFNDEQMRRADDEKI